MAPKDYPHLRTKPKKNQMLEERYTEIERENRILLEKMTYILQNPKGISNANPMQQSTFAAQTSGFQQSSLGQLPNRKSLNREARNREFRKITQENALILKRLQEKQPSYNVTKWAREDNERRKILENICEYPYVLLDKNGEPIDPNFTPNGPPDFIIKKKNRTHYPSAPGSGGMYS